MHHYYSPRVLSPMWLVFMLQEPWLPSLSSHFHYKYFSWENFLSTIDLQRSAPISCLNDSSFTNYRF